MSSFHWFGSALLGAALALGCGNPGPAAGDCGEGRSCDCQPGDRDCNPCQSGYRPALVGSECVPTCNAPNIDCGAHGQCEESPQGAACRCDAGYTGESCASCEAGLSPNEVGQCFGKLSAPALLSLSSVDDELVLGALVPPLWSFVPLASAPSSVTDVAYDQGSQRVYTLQAGRLSTLELTNGQAQSLTPANVDLGTALCVDSAERRAFTASADAIHQVDLDALEVTEIASFGARALEYDAERGILMGVDAEGATFELVGTAPVTRGRAPELEGPAMAFDASAGRAYFMGSEAETEPARLLRFCGQALTRLGAIPAWQSRIVAEMEPGAAAPYTLDYDRADPALVALELDLDGPSKIRVTATHPDAALCIVSEGSGLAELELEVSDRARASFLLVVAPERDVRLDLTATSQDVRSNIFVHTREGLSIAGPSGSVTEYGQQSWANLGLTTLENLPPAPSSRLLLMDWASQATLSLELAHRAVGGLAWVGEAP